MEKKRKKKKKPKVASKIKITEQHWSKQYCHLNKFAFQNYEMNPL